MSSRFQLVINFGFFSNCVILAYLVCRIMTKEDTTKQFGVTLMCVNFFINLMWIVQFIMLLSFRFSHQGEVCSGDYQEYSQVKKDGHWVPDAQYDNYFLKSEGKFMLIYGMIAIWSVGICLCCGGCLGACLFVGSSVEAFNNIEDTFKNMDSFNDIVTKYAKDHGYGPPPDPT